MIAEKFNIELFLTILHEIAIASTIWKHTSFHHIHRWWADASDCTPRNSDQFMTKKIYINNLRPVHAAEVLHVMAVR